MRSGGVIPPMSALEKILTSAITIGSGGAGGIIAPSLFLGAASGGALGMAVAAPRTQRHPPAARIRADRNGRGARRRRARAVGGGAHSRGRHARLRRRAPRD